MGYATGNCMYWITALLPQYGQLTHYNTHASSRSLSVTGVTTLYTVFAAADALTFRHDFIVSS